MYFPQTIKHAYRAYECVFNHLYVCFSIYFLLHFLSSFQWWNRFFQKHGWSLFNLALKLKMCLTNGLLNRKLHLTAKIYQPLGLSDSRTWFNLQQCWPVISRTDTIPGDEVIRLQWKVGFLNYDCLLFEIINIFWAFLLSSFKYLIF